MSEPSVAKQGRPCWNEHFGFLFYAPFIMADSEKVIFVLVDADDLDSV